MTPEALRALAFDQVYVLAASERSESPKLSTEKLLAPLTIEERDRVLKVATRRLAFQFLYQLDAMRPMDAAALAEFLTSTLSGIVGLGPMALADIRYLVTGAHDGRKAADDEFLALAPEWPTTRLAAVDRAILRLSHYEMISGRTPPKIAINEAVELAKHYSTEKSPAFINGLLDKVLHRLDPTAPDTTTSESPAITK